MSETNKTDPISKAISFFMDDGEGWWDGIPIRLLGLGLPAWGGYTVGVLLGDRLSCLFG